MTESLQLLTVQETAALLKTSRAQVRKMIRAGLLNAVKVGREWRISMEFIREFLETNMV